MVLIGERVVADIRSEVYRRVIRFIYASSKSLAPAKCYRADHRHDTGAVDSGVNLSITLRSLVSLVGALIAMLITSPRLTAMVIVALLGVMVPLVIVGRRVRLLSRDSQDRIADTSGLAGETLNAIQTVQAFTLDKMHRERIQKPYRTRFYVACSERAHSWRRRWAACW